MRALLVVLLACTTLTGVPVEAGLHFDPRVVLDTTAITDTRPWGYGEKVCTSSGVECWIEYHPN